MPLRELTRSFIDDILIKYPKLESLNLSHNALRTLGEIYRFIYLQHLDISYNLLIQLPFEWNEIESCPIHLTYLNAHENQLKSIQPLYQCKELQSLILSNNQITLFTELLHLKSLSKLESLVLIGNPITKTSISNYRRQVITILPQLKYLDHEEITLAERFYATGRPLPPTIFDDQEIQETKEERINAKDFNSSLLTPENIQKALSIKTEFDQVSESSSRRFSTTSSQLILSNYSPHKPPYEQYVHTTKDSGVQTVARDDRGEISSDVVVHSQWKKKDLLQERIDALEKILQLQDQQIHSQLKKTTSPADTEAVETIKDPTLVYMKRLNLWRSKVMELLVQQKSYEITSRNEQTSMKKQMKETMDQYDHLKTVANVRLEEIRDGEAQRKIIIQKLQRKEREVSTLETKYRSTYEMVLSTRQQLHILSQAVSLFAQGPRNTGNTSIESHVSVWHFLQKLQISVKKLENFHARVNFMKESIESLHFCLNAREATLRNSQAALEAELRVIRYQKKSSLEDTKTIDEKRKLRISQRTFHTLKQIFKCLDTDQTGFVPTNTLLAVLQGHEIIHDSACDINLVEVMNKQGDSKQMKKLATQLEEYACSHRRVTFGEIVLFLMPTDAEPNSDEDELIIQHPIDTSTKRKVKKCEDLNEWKTTYESLSREQLLQAFCQSMKTQKAMKERVSMNQKVIEKIVEKATEQYKSKLKTLMEEIQTLRRTGSLREKKFEEMNKERMELESNLHQAQQDKDKLIATMKVKEKEWETQLNDFVERSRYQIFTNENEIQQLQQELINEREISKTTEQKLNMENTQLERNLARLKELNQVKEQERNALMERQLEKRDNEIAKLRRERNSLLNSLREQERKASKLNVETSTIGTQASIDDSSHKNDEIPKADRASQTIEYIAADPKQVHVPEDNIDTHKRANDSMNPLTYPEYPKKTISISQRLKELESLTETLLQD